MHTLRTLLLLPFAVLAAAQSEVLFFTRVPNPITDGESAAILWSTNDTTTPVTLTLLQGLNTSNLGKVEIITDKGTNGQYIWHPSVSIADGQNYALGITQGSQKNYFGPLIIQGSSPSAVSSASLASSISAYESTATGAKVTLTRNATTVVQPTTKHTLAITTTVAESSTTASIAAATSSTAPTQSGSTVQRSSLALILGAVATLFCVQ